MFVLWERGRVSVNEVVQALPSDPLPAHDARLTYVRIVEQKGDTRRRDARSPPIHMNSDTQHLGVQVRRK